MIWKFAALELEERRRHLLDLQNHTTSKLRTRVFDLLAYLMHHRNELVSR